MCVGTKYFIIARLVFSVYINHRPVFGLEEQKLRWAFETLGIAQDDGMSSISREDILDLLQNHGG